MVNEYYTITGDVLPLGVICFEIATPLVDNINKVL